MENKSMGSEIYSSIFILIDDVGIQWPYNVNEYMLEMRELTFNDIPPNT